MEQHQQHLIEQRQTDQNRDEFLSWLRFLSWITTILGLVLLFTSNGSGPSQLSSALLDLMEKIPYITSGLMVIVGLMCFVFAYSMRKDSKGFVAFFIVAALVMFLLSWHTVNSIPQIQIIQVSH